MRDSTSGKRKSSRLRGGRAKTPNSLPKPKRRRIRQVKSVNVQQKNSAREDLVKPNSAEQEKSVNRKHQSLTRDESVKPNSAEKKKSVNEKEQTLTRDESVKTAEQEKSVNKKQQSSTCDESVNLNSTEKFSNEEKLVLTKKVPTKKKSIFDTSSSSGGESVNNASEKEKSLQVEQIPLTRDQQFRMHVRQNKEKNRIEKKKRKEDKKKDEIRKKNEIRVSMTDAQMAEHKLIMRNRIYHSSDESVEKPKEEIRLSLTDAQLKAHNKVMRGRIYHSSDESSSSSGSGTSSGSSGSISSDNDKKMPALTDTQLALRNETNVFVNDASSDRSISVVSGGNVLSTEVISGDNVLSTEEKAELEAHNDRARTANPSDCVYIKSRCCMGEKCKGPTMELRNQYLCDICGQIYHNIVCGTKSGTASLCFSCITDSEKAIEKPAVASVTKATHNKYQITEELEELIQEDNFGRNWFYKTNAELQEYMHFFHTFEKQPPRMYQVKPKDVLFHDLRNKVSFFMCSSCL